MSERRYVTVDGLSRVIRQAVPAGSNREACLAAVERFLRRQPRTPRLVGTTQAAKILGVQPPHVTRLREQGRMPEAIEVEGSVDVYVRDEVEDLGRELHAERQQRAARRAEREETKT